MVVAAAFCLWIVTCSANAMTKKSHLPRPQVPQAIAVGSDPPLASRVLTGFRGGELLRRTLAMCPETCSCGAMMVIRDDVTDAEEIAATMTRLGLCSTPPPLGRAAKSSSEVQYVFADC